MLKEKLHHMIINNNQLYNTIKFSQNFPFKNTRRYFRNRYINKNLRQLKPDINQKPIGQVCIETTSLCNTKCSFCPHSEMKREKKIMSDKVFRKAMIEIKSMHIKDIGMYYFGEPLTDPKLFKRIRMMKKDYPCHIQIITNGLDLDKEKSQHIISSDADELLISLDATDKESYEKVRKGSFNKVVDNIKNFMKIRGYYRVNETGYKNTPKVIVRTMVTGNNKKEVKKFTKQWKYVVDEVQYGRIHNFCNDYIEAQQKHLINQPCLFLWTQLIILSNGDVVPCCMDYEGKLKLGNIMNKPLRKIWNGDMIQWLRKRHLEGDYPKICKNCDVNESLVAKWWNYD